MNAINLAVVSPSDPKTITAILTVYANDKREALDKVKKDPDMTGVRVYPIDQDKLTEH